MNIFVLFDDIGEYILHFLQFEPSPTVLITLGTLLIINPQTKSHIGTLFAVNKM